MHSTQREEAIFAALSQSGFVSYRQLEASLDASPATIRRDLARLETEGRITRVHGGARLVEDGNERASLSLKGTPFEKSVALNIGAKQAVARKAAELCQAGEGIIIDGGSTTYQMCDHLAGKNLQVLTNSLHIVNALLPQEDTQVLLPSGTIFREQNIILAPSGEASMPNFHATKLFLGAAAISERGIFQADAILVASQRRLLDLADEIILLVDSSKLSRSSGAIVCGLNRISKLIIDSQTSAEQIAQLSASGVGEIIVA